MHSTDYQKLALRTEVTPPFISTTVGRGESEANRLGRLLHAAIGMVTEIGELEEQAAAGGHDRVNVIEEIGDIYWYVNLAIDACGTNWDDDRLRLHAYEASLESAIYRMVCTAGQLMDIYKKHLIYGKPFTLDNVLLQCGYIISSAGSALYVIGSSQAEAMDRNIAKLQKRFPVKFTEEAALNRNLEAERAALEGK